LIGIGIHQASFKTHVGKANSQILRYGRFTDTTFKIGNSYFHIAVLIFYKWFSATNVVYKNVNVHLYK
jgi:hypothetical protein